MPSPAPQRKARDSAIKDGLLSRLVHEENPSVNPNAVFILIICGPAQRDDLLGAGTNQFLLFLSAQTDTLFWSLSLHKEPDFICQVPDLTRNVNLASKTVGYFGVEGNSLTCKRIK